MKHAATDYFQPVCIGARGGDARGFLASSAPL